MVIGFQPLGKRMCYLRLKSGFFNFSIINVHAPTGDKEKEVKEPFYEKLEGAYDKLPANDIRFIVGDMNAKSGKENILRNHAGMHRQHENTSENGSRLVNFAVSKNMFIESTKFNHKIIHKNTWKSLDGKTENQIDHLLIDKRHLSDLMDVRSYGGANIESDLYLVGIQLRVRIPNAKTSTL
jgi:exonuclease III